LSDSEPSLVEALAPRPGGNPPGIPPDFLYDPKYDVYEDPRCPSKYTTERQPTRPPYVSPESVWDEGTQTWYVPGAEECTFDTEAWRREFKKTLEESRNEPPIPPEQLIIPPGTFDVPAAWRESLGGGTKERDLFSDLVEEDEPGRKSQKAKPRRPKSNASADEPR
jgi:hypothetical protein